MKATIKKITKYQSKYDNEFFELSINDKIIGTYEKSELRHLIEIIDNTIHY